MKLPEREFKAGDRVWSIRDGFVTVVVNNDKYRDKEYCFKSDKGCRYKKNGYDEYNAAHRSLFTLEEALKLFGVNESDQKKVMRWKYIMKLKDDFYPPHETSGYFKSDSELENFYNFEIRWFKRIEESMREFEE